KNGRIIDGSGRPAFHGDAGVSRGKIVELGRLDGPARRVIEADGRVVAPGFIDNHCHYDAQVLWDPLCTFSCHHGATTVIIGNCSLALAPVKEQERAELAGMLSYVEAIPMGVLQAGVPWNWGTLPEQRRLEGRWKTHLSHVEETVRQRIRAIPLCNPGSVVNQFPMGHCQVFRSMPTWLPILQGPDDDKLRAYRDPATRAKLRAE